MAITKLNATDQHTTGSDFPKFSHGVLTELSLLPGILKATVNYKRHSS